MCCIPACVGDEDDGCGQGLPPADPAGTVGPDQICENQMRIRRSPFVLDLRPGTALPGTLLNLAIAPLRDLSMPLH